MNVKKITHEGREYRKSSYSPKGWDIKCVGVSIDEENVYAINTNKKDIVISFTIEEWKAFILGVKDDEFDVGV
ncbi:MAG: DUF397 domain-containing protein [Candidatus Anammoxibacter sp.]